MSESWGQPQQQPGGDWSVPQGAQGGGEQGSFGPPPMDPHYGTPSPQYGGSGQPPQPQYGAPQQPYGEQPHYGDQPQYGEQPQYGAPPPQYGAAQPQYGSAPQYGGPVPPPGGGYGYPAPQEQKNGLAVAGFVLSITAILGLIFSILGFNRSARIGGKGRGLAVAGIVLSLLFGAGWVALGYKVANSTALDPGCTSAESAFRNMLSTIEADETKLTNDASGSDQNALQTDLAKFTTDVQGIKTALDSALAKAEHQSVKEKIQAMDTDINTVLNGLKAIQNGDVSQVTEFEAAATRLGSDGDALDKICGSL